MVADADELLASAWGKRGGVCGAPSVRAEVPLECLCRQARQVRSQGQFVRPVASALGTATAWAGGATPPPPTTTLPLPPYTKDARSRINQERVVRPLRLRLKLDASSLASVACADCRPCRRFPLPPPPPLRTDPPARLLAAVAPLFGWGNDPAALSAAGRWPRCPSPISSTRARRTTSPLSTSSPAFLLADSRRLASCRRRCLPSSRLPSPRGKAINSEARRTTPSRTTDPPWRSPPCLPSGRACAAMPCSTPRG